MIFKNQYKNIRALYMSALGFIAFLSFSFFVYINASINKNKEFSWILNVSGKQRMLSQRSVLIADIQLSSPDFATKEKLERLIKEMKDDHNKLKCKKLDTDCDLELEKKINKKFEDHLEVLNSNDKEIIDNYVKNQLSVFLYLLNKRVEYFEALANESIDKVIFAEKMILIIILITLGLEVIFIFRPILKELFNSLEDLRATNSKISHLNQEKEQILDDLSHNLRTPMNEVMNLTNSDEINSKKEELKIAIKKIQHSIEYFLRIHKDDDTLTIYNVTRLPRVSEQVTLQDHCTISLEDDSSFYTLNKEALVDLCNSSFYLAKACALNVDIYLGERTRLVFTGDQNEINNLNSSYDDRDSHSDIIFKTFYTRLSNFNYSKKISKNTVEYEIAIEEYERPDTNYEIKKVLIVDDNAINTKILKTMSMSYNPELVIDTASDGFEALQLTHETQYDLIFMDIKMPIMDGIESVSKIRKHDGLSHIVMVSANAFQDQIRKSMHVGANGFVAKPISKDKIFEEFDFAKRYKGKFKVII